MYLGDRKPLLCLEYINDTLIHTQPKFSSSYPLHNVREINLQIVTMARVLAGHNSE